MPLGIDNDYLTTVKPSGLFRVMVKASSAPGGNTHTYKTIAGNGAEVSSSIAESADDYAEITAYASDLSTHMGDFKVTVTPGAGATFSVSPVEFLVDIPVSLGCFEMPASLENKVRT